MTDSLFNDDLTPRTFAPAPKLARTASATSAEAAEKVAPFVREQCRRVFDAIDRFGGQTDEQLERYLSMEGNTVRPRRGELVTAGFVAKSGRTRPNDKGNAMTVWVATDLGRAEFRRWAEAS